MCELTARHGRVKACARQGHGMLCANRPLVSTFFDGPSLLTRERGVEKIFLPGPKTTIENPGNSVNNLPYILISRILFNLHFTNVISLLNPISNKSRSFTLLCPTFKTRKNVHCIASRKYRKQQL